MTATIAAEDVQEQAPRLVRRSEEITLGVIKRAVEAVNAAAGKLPASPATGQPRRLPSLSKLPGVSALPAPETVVSATFDFLDRLLAEQRRFADEVLKATSGLRPAAEPEPEPEPEPAGGEPGPAAG